MMRSSRIPICNKSLKGSNMSSWSIYTAVSSTLLFLQTGQFAHHILIEIIRKSCYAKKKRQVMGWTGGVKMRVEIKGDNHRWHLMKEIYMWLRWIASNLGVCLFLRVCLILLELSNLFLSKLMYG